MLTDEKCRNNIYWMDISALVNISPKYNYYTITVTKRILNQHHHNYEMWSILFIINIYYFDFAKFVLFSIGKYKLNYELVECCCNSHSLRR